MSTPSVYKDGTITATIGSATVAGSGTAWSTQLKRASAIYARVSLGGSPESLDWVLLGVVESVTGDAEVVLYETSGIDLDGAEYFAITWNSGAEIAEYVRTLMTEQVSKGLHKNISGVPLAADFRENDVIRDRLTEMRYTKDQGVITAITPPAFSSVSAWEGVARSLRQELTISGSPFQTAIDFSAGSDALLILSDDTDIQPPTNIAVGSEIDLLIVVSGGPHSLTWDPVFTPASGFLLTEIRGGDGERSRVTLTVTAETGGVATAVTVAPVLHDTFALVSDGDGVGFVSRVDDNFDEPQFDVGGDPLDTDSWVWFRLPQGDPGSAVVTGVSASSNVLGPGEKTFTITEAEARGWAAGALLNIASAANPLTHRFVGVPITSYAHPTLVVQVPSDGFLGTGSRADWVISLSGGPGADGSDPGLLYTWDTGTADADPGAGKIRANNADLSAATVLYVSKTTRGGAAIGDFLNALDASTNASKGTLALTRPADEAQCTFVFGTVTDAVNYVKIDVSVHGGATTFIAADAISLQPTRDGNAGADGDVPGTRTLTAGAGLTGGGDLSTDRSFAVGAGTGIAVGADDVAVDKATDANVRAAAANKVLTADLIESASSPVALTPAATVAIDWDAGINFYLSIDQNSTLGLPTNGQLGTWRFLTVYQTGSPFSTFTLDPHADYLLPGGLAEDISANAVSNFAIYCDKNGDFHLMPAGMDMTIA